jgi:hypothetical protein
MSEAGPGCRARVPGQADASTLIRFYRTGASERGGRSRDPQGRRRAIESRPTTSGVALLYRTWTGASERGGRSRDPQGRRRAIESRPTTSRVAFLYPTTSVVALLYRAWRGAVAKKRGGRRIVVACSYANASFTSVGSLHADAKNDTPTGKPNTNPAGTVMCG